jgi:hypothetical protein
MLEIRTRKGHLIWGTGPALRIAAVASAVAIAALCFRSSLLPMMRLAATQAAEYTFIFFASIALIALYAGFAERWRLHRFFQSPLLIFPSAALLAAGVYKLGMHQFGGFDEGLLVHAATYYAQGFKPYIDFPCTMPPLFMASIRGCVTLFGLHWSSLALMTAAFAALTSLWMFTILRSAAVPRHWALAVTICVEISTILVAPFWWYNNTSYLPVVLLLISVLACLQQPKQWLPWISLSLSLAMVLAAKPNVEPACLMVLVLLATTDKSQWLKTFSSCAGALALAWSICNAAQMPPAALLNSYTEIAKLRGNPLAMVPFRHMEWPESEFQFLFLFVNALCFALLLAISARRQPREWRQLSVCAIAALTSLLLACTNAEFKSSDLSILLVAATFLFLRPWQPQELSARRKTVLAGWLIVFLVTSGFFAVIHLRILLIGEGLFYEPFPTTKVQSGFFSGLEAGPGLQKTLSQIATVLSMYPAKTVFFGPRIEFAYAQFNKPLTPRMPLLWDPGNLFSYSRFPRLLLTFQQQNPDLLIFLKEDYSLMGPVGIYIRNTATYRRIDTFSQLTIYVRKNEVPITFVRIPASSPPQ